MKNKDASFGKVNVKAQLSALVKKLVRLAPLGFFVIVAALFAFLLLRINSLSNIQPNESEMSSEVTKLTPHIDQKSVAQLKSLEDNSVNVQTLFSQARNNPFGE